MTSKREEPDQSDEQGARAHRARRDASLPSWLSLGDDGVWLIRVKAVPGASRDEIVGPLGDRLKVRVAAPPEGGKANEAIRRLVAKTLGVAERDVELIAGESSAEKVFRADVPDVGAFATLMG